MYLDFRNILVIIYELQGNNVFFSCLVFKNIKLRLNIHFLSIIASKRHRLHQHEKYECLKNGSAIFCNFVWKSFIIDKSFEG